MLKFLQNAKLFLRLHENKSSSPHGFLSEKKTLRIILPQRYFSSGASEAENVEVDINAVTQGDADLEHKLKVLMLEAEVMRQEGHSVPSESFLKTKHWQELIKLETRSGRKKYLEFVFKIEKKRENEEIKKERRRTEFSEKKSQQIEPVTDHLRYGLGDNNIFLRFYDTTINNLYNSKLIEAMQFGQKLVVDCGYDRHMTSRENSNCAKQLMFLFSENRAHEDPFDLHFCNSNLQSSLMLGLHKFITTMYEPWFPLSIHERSYTEIFPKEQLIYLTPHCKEEMKEYDHDAIYIIGGIVDKVNTEPLSLAKAKEEGLRMLKLPLDRHLQWGAGSGKSLTLNQVVSILLDVKRTNDWKHALRHVPKRKLYDHTPRSNMSNAPDLSYDKNSRPQKSFNFSYNNQRERKIEGSGNRRMRDIKSIFDE